jgi:penicillin-binding protein 2
MSKEKKNNLICYGFLTPFLLLLIFLFRFQILEGEKYQRIAEYNFVRVQTVFPIRGEIFDRHFRPIAVNKPSTNLYILPAKVKNITEVAEFVSSHLPVTEDDLKDLLYRNRFRAYQEHLLCQNLEFQKVVEISEHLEKYPSLLFKTEQTRHYSINNHFTGYISKINRPEYEEFKERGYTINCQIGKTGLEKQYEEYLRGENGYRIIQVDASGRNLQFFKDDLDKPAINGSDLILTIDLKLQEYIESVFPDEYNGAVLILDTKKGGVLSYVSRPVFDLNVFSRSVGREYWANLVVDPSFPLMDRIAMASYPPASTFKTVITAVSLDNSIIQPDTKMTRCTGSFRYGNRQFNCWHETGHGVLDLSDAIKHSCNVYFYDLSLLLELPLLERFVVDNYLVARTGIDLPNERRGFFPSEEWYVDRLGSRALITGHKINLVIGQGEVLLSPLQIGAFYNALANDGEWKQPFLFSRLIDSGSEDKTGKNNDTKKQLTIKPETLSLIQNSLFRAVNESGGTGSGARVRGAHVYGKTGTAQNPAGSDPHVWFAGYAGWNEAEIAIVVLIENYPGTGGSFAAPLAGKIIRYYQDNIRSFNNLAYKHDEIHYP